MSTYNDNNYIDKFKNISKTKKITIDKIEDLMFNEINDYKKHIEHLTEELISSEINEKELIDKKNRI